MWKEKLVDCLNQVKNDPGHYFYLVRTSKKEMTQKVWTSKSNDPRYTLAKKYSNKTSNKTS